MGSQVNFFLTPGDTVRLEQSIRQVGPLLALHSRSATASPRQVSSLDVMEDGAQWLFFHLVRPEDLGSVVTRHVPAQGYWTVDVLRSPVIEFNRCYFDNHILRCGRIYYTPSFFGPDDALVAKSPDFLAWAKQLFATAKKHMKRQGAEYIGAEAEAWVAAGGVLKR